MQRKFELVIVLSLMTFFLTVSEVLVSRGSVSEYETRSKTQNTVEVKRHSRNRRRPRRVGRFHSRSAHRRRAAGRRQHSAARGRTVKVRTGKMRSSSVTDRSINTD